MEAVDSNEASNLKDYVRVSFQKRGLMKTISYIWNFHNQKELVTSTTKDNI